MKKILSALFLLGSSTVLANVPACLVSAYPNLKMVDSGRIQFPNGNIMNIGQISQQPFLKVLNNPTIADQLAQRYQLEFKVPNQYQDAGRIRNDAFFKHLYGANLQEVNQNIVSVFWKPSQSFVRFNRLNGASEQLRKVGEEIAQYPDFISYVNKSLGTLNFRKIAGTNRLSAHSFGIAIDFQLPKHLHKYWRWDGCTSEDRLCPYPKQLIEDEKLKRIVRIFEKYGFIWGGKWASYDSVHFEYRPELLISQCR